MQSFAYDTRPSGIANVIGHGRQLGPLLRSVSHFTPGGKPVYNFTTTQMRKFAQQLGFKATGTSRESISDSIEVHPAAIHYSAQLGQLVSNAAELKAQDGKLDVPMTTAEREMLDAARSGDWARLITWSAMTANPMETAARLSHEVDIAAYGERTIIADVKVKWPFSNFEEDTYDDISIRSVGPVPTPKEIVRALNLARKRDRTVFKDYLKRSTIDPDWVEIVEVKDRIRITRNMDWAHRAHHDTSGCILKYMNIEDQPESLETVLKANTTESCGWKIANEDLGITDEEIFAIVNKPKEDGLFMSDMINIYKSKQASLYCYDLDHSLHEKYVVPKEDRAYSHSDGLLHSFALIFANEHVYRPCGSLRDLLISKLTSVKQDDVELKEAKKTKERVDIRAHSYHHAMRIAEPFAEKRRMYDIGSIENRKKRALGTIHFETQQRLKSFVPTKHGMTKKNFIGNLTLEKEQKKKKYEKQLEDAKEYFKNEYVPVNIYVPTDDLKVWYSTEISTTERIFRSNIDESRSVTSIQIAPGINIYANKDYDNLKMTAKQLNIPYINQNIAALARASFKTFKKSDRDGSNWDKSLLNASITKLVETYPATAPNHTWFRFKAEDEEIEAVDFYRQYTSIAHAGDFYFVPLLSDVEPYNGHEIGEEPFMYGVKTSDALLFEGNGLYDYKVVACGLSENIITLDDIILQVRVIQSRKIDKTLKNWIDHVYKVVKSDSYRKEIVTKFIGSLRTMHKFTGKKSIITNRRDEASYYYNTMRTNQKHMRELCTTKDGKPVYLVAGCNMVPKRQTDEIVQRTIVQRGRMQTYMLMKHIEKNPAFQVVEVKTDAVYYLKPKNMPRFPTDDKRAFGTTRREELKQAVRDLPGWNYKPFNPNTIDFTTLKIDWQEPLGLLSEVDDLDPKRVLALDRAFIKGFAGSGKTHLLTAMKAIIEGPKRPDGSPVVKVHVASFTHAAAHLVEGGVTLHHLFGLSRHGTVNESKVASIINSNDVLMIDEVSLSPGIFYDILTQIPKENKLYMFGDFDQHKPIEENIDHAMYCNTTMFKSMIDFNLITLQKQYRTDKIAANQCRKFAEVARIVGVIDAVKVALPRGIKIATDETPIPDMNICFDNPCRIKINNRKLADNIRTISDINERRHRPYDRNPERTYTVERCNADKLKHLIDNPTKYPGVYKSMREGATEDSVLEHCKSYFANLVIDPETGIGYKATEYYRSSQGRGRDTAEGSQSLINIARGIRHIIASEYYIDIDCVNCHPSILLQLCDKMGIGKAIPLLRDYVTKRDEVFATLKEELPGFDKDNYKKLILSLINGGAKDFRVMNASVSPWAVKFKAEAELIHYCFMKKYPEQVPAHLEHRREKDKWTGSDGGSFVNMFLIDAEVRILAVIVSEMRRRNLLGVNGDDVVLCYDGLMVLKSDKIDQALLDDISKVVLARTKFHMKLMPKPMIPIELPANLPRATKDNSLLKYLDPRTWDEFPRLAANMPAISNFTDGKGAYFNNERFTITDIAHGENKEIAMYSINPITEAKKEITISHDRFRRDFRPGYCITSYKLQGTTLTEPYGIHQFFGGSRALDAHGAYVAITRATLTTNITLFGKKADEPTEDQLHMALAIRAHMPNKQYSDDEQDNEPRESSPASNETLKFVDDAVSFALASLMM